MIARRLGAGGRTAAAAATARAGLLLAGLALSLALRIAVGGAAGGTSLAGDAVFGAACLSLCALAGWRPGRPGARRLIARLAVGVAGGAVLVAVPVAARLAGGPHPRLAGGVGWGETAAFGAATVVVVCAEEVLLRGALWGALEEVMGARGEWVAMAVGAVAFALLHVPWYGWGILRVDLAAGLWLGALRLATGGVSAPWAAHAGADLATWWLL